MPRIKRGTKHWKTRDSLTKVLMLLKYLSDHRFGGTVKELMAEIEVSRRSLYRYFVVLEQAGIEMNARPGPGAGEARYRLVDRPTYARLFQSGVTL
jgi:predicted DNA-binding transcriptional regulator YafY